MFQIELKPFKLIVLIENNRSSSWRGINEYAAMQKLGNSVCLSDLIGVVWG
jgi:hypothetical protein